MHLVPEDQPTDCSTTWIHKRRNLRLQQIQRPSKRTAKSLAPEKIRHDCQGQLVEEADKLCRVCEVRGLVGAAGDIAEVDAREGVYFAGVTAH